MHCFRYRLVFRLLHVDYVADARAYVYPQLLAFLAAFCVRYFTKWIVFRPNCFYSRNVCCTDGGGTTERGPGYQPHLEFCR